MFHAAGGASLASPLAHLLTTCNSPRTALRVFWVGVPWLEPQQRTWLGRIAALAAVGCPVVPGYAHAALPAARSRSGGGISP